MADVLEEVSKQAGPIPFDLAERYLREHGLSQGLQYWHGEYYLFEKTHYRRLTQDEFKNNVVRWLQGSPELRRFTKTSTVNNIVLNIGAKCQLHSGVALQSWLEDSAYQAARLVNVSNGILDLDALLTGANNPLQPHSPLLFSTACLPYSFDPEADCPTWRRFLAKMQPDETIRGFLQEWFGYNLIFDTCQEKFVLFVGEGANGKTVACVVLRCLLGEQNVSAVGLEAFSPTRTFPLAATVGKLANIVEELNEVDRAAEGELKKFVSGGLMTVERKHQDPFEFRPTARITFASNVLPRFVDRSDGLWRRLILIPFNVRLIKEADQDKRLIDPKFWQESGELPGILNWGIAGLSRLLKRERFQEPKACAEAKGAFKRDANPAKTFLQDYCVETTMGCISSRDLYRAYAEYMQAHGQHPLSEPQFGQEVRRMFPQSNKSANAIHLPGGGKSHVWYGIKLADGTTGTVIPTLQQLRGNK